MDDIKVRELAAPFHTIYGFDEVAFAKALLDQHQKDMRQALQTALREGMAEPVDLPKPCCACGVRGDRLAGPLDADGLCPVCARREVMQKPLYSTRQDAARFRKLRGLMGYVENGSDTKVTLFQDDATRSFHVNVGSVGHWGASLGEAIDKHPEPEV